MVFIDSRFLHRNVLARVIRFQSLLSVVYLWFNVDKDINSVQPLL